MTKLKLALIFLLSQILSCSTKPANELPESKKSLNKDFLPGAWWSDDKISALFYIENDSLFYTEEQDFPYAIRISNDTLFMEQRDFRRSFKVIKLTADSLIFYDQSIKEKISLGRH